jgi:hypothetical protein
VLVVLDEFEVETHRAKTMELLSLRQQGSVEEYRKKFEQLVYNIRLYDKSLSNTMLTAQFLLGLKAELRPHVEMKLPEIVAKATILAIVQEQLLEKSRKGMYKGGAYGKSISLNEKSDSKSFASAEIWKTRQLKEYTRTNGLCYKCGEKFIPGRKCSVPVLGAQATQLAAIMEFEIGDGGGILLDAMLEAMELQSSGTEPDCHISLYAISGAATNKAIHLRALVDNQVLSILVDSGSSNTFLNADMLQRIPYSAQKATPLTVRVANGQTIISDEVVPCIEWWIQGHTFSTDVRVLHLGAYDMILGMDWLEEHSPMQCDWSKKSMSFNHNGKFITLQGLTPNQKQK